MCRTSPFPLRGPWLVQIGHVLLLSDWLVNLVLSQSARGSLQKVVQESSNQHKAQVCKQEKELVRSPGEGIIWEGGKPAGGWKQSTEKSRISRNAENQNRGPDRTPELFCCVSSTLPQLLLFKLIWVDFWLFLLESILKHPYLPLPGPWRLKFLPRALHSTSPRATSLCQATGRREAFKIRQINQGMLLQENSGDA